MPEEKQTPKMPHNLIMQERKNLSVGGVTDVDRFDEQTVTVYTTMGELTIRGTALHIGKLNTETGDLTVTGNIIALVYTDERQRTDGLLARLFR